MKTMIDFYKIDKGKLRVINLNNMIPVDDLFINKLHPIVSKNMNKVVFGYNTVLIKQLDWCNKHREEIYESALLLYSKVLSKNINKKILEICVDFKLLELKLIEYINKLKEK